MKQSITAGLVMGASTMLVLAGVASAMTTSGDAMMHSDSTMPSSMMMMHPPAPMILNVGNDGTGRLRGVVASITSTSLTIAGWGGVWTVTTDGNTAMMPTGTAMTDIKVGDYVGVVGKVSENGPTIAASVVRDWTTKHDAMMMKTDGTMMQSGAMTKEDLMKKVDELNQKIKMEQDKMNGDHMMSTTSGSMMH